MIIGSALSRRHHRRGRPTSTTPGSGCRSTRSRSWASRSSSSSGDLGVRRARVRLGNDEFERIPTGAIGLYTYYERLAQGLRQLMAGARKFSTELIARDDIAALTHEAAELSGITYVMDVDKEACGRLMNA